MDKPLRIYLIIASVFILIGCLIVYNNWDTNKKHAQSLSYLDPKDPLLIKAKEKARLTIDTLFRLYPLYPGQAFVKIPLKDVDGQEEHRWGQLKDLQRDHVSIVLKEPGAGNTGVEEDKERQLPMEQVEDWLVDVDSGKVRGGFTTQVILLRNKGMDEKTAMQQLKLFLDPL